MVVFPMKFLKVKYSDHIIVDDAVELRNRTARLFVRALKARANGQAAVAAQLIHMASETLNRARKRERRPRGGVAAHAATGSIKPPNRATIRHVFSGRKSLRTKLAASE
jgi:hypothetical protein